MLPAIPQMITQVTESAASGLPRMLAAKAGAHRAPAKAITTSEGIGMQIEPSSINRNTAREPLSAPSRWTVSVKTASRVKPPCDQGERPERTNRAGWKGHGSVLRRWYGPAPGRPQGRGFPERGTEQDAEDVGRGRVARQGEDDRALPRARLPGPGLIRT